MSSSRSSSVESCRCRKHLLQGLGGNDLLYLAALRGSPTSSSSAHLADQAFQQPHTSISISAAEPLQDGPWHDNPALRSPFQVVQQAAAPARPGITGGA